MGVFTSKVEGRIQELATALVTPLNSIALAFAGYPPLDELRRQLEQDRLRLSALVNEMTEADRLSAYDRYWAKERTILGAIFSAGAATEDEVRRLQLEWVRTMQLSMLYQEAPTPHTTAPGRPWVPALENVEFTYVETIRLTDDTLDQLTAIAPTLTEARGGGLALGGVVYGNVSSEPLSPDWVSVRSAALRQNGLAAAAGHPSHRLLDKSDALDLGARDGRNSFAWDGGLSMPNWNLYVGSAEHKYFELTQISGEVVSLDLSSDGSKIAVVEHWGGSDYWVALVDAATGRRRYLLHPSDKNYVGRNIQFSPGDNWLLVSDRRGMSFIAADGSSLIDMPFEGISSAGWWPSRGPSCLAIIYSTAEAKRLAAFDLATGLSEDLGPILSPDPALPRDRRYYADINVHPSRNIALIGAREGPHPDHQEEHGSRYRVAELNLEPLLTCACRAVP